MTPVQTQWPPAPQTLDEELANTDSTDAPCEQGLCEQEVGCRSKSRFMTITTALVFAAAISAAAERTIPLSNGYADHYVDAPGFHAHGYTVNHGKGTAPPTGRAAASAAPGPSSTVRPKRGARHHQDHRRADHTPLPRRPGGPLPDHQGRCRTCWKPVQPSSRRALDGASHFIKAARSTKSRHAMTSPPYHRWPMGMLRSFPPGAAMPCTRPSRTAC